MTKLKIVSIVDREDGTRAFSVRPESSGSMTPPRWAYAPREGWNANWKVGDTVECDAREKVSAANKPYLSLYPTASQANEEPRTISDEDAIRILSLSLHARLGQFERRITRKINAALGIEDEDDEADVPQPNFTPGK